MKKAKAGDSARVRTVANVTVAFIDDRAGRELFIHLATPSITDGVERFWPVAGYLPREAQVTDAMAWLSKELHTAIVGLIGVQEVLER